ncbi:monoamine oxidase [Chitinophaga sp. CF118]|uniref:flavin monoamine oxidase family protein n=1 Tax=Chitinophaga sp. CF118 TaxID=1884367 RepID=UPI0008E520D9|nr:NAD(P)/FAD-dependent oxidoreductase [Chitinophaga sp. CF118]SFE44357.1 monoamine oxidase [Chitinophaga sp. CF118]
MDIIIIGAGASGLMAARELSASYKVTILEAKEIIGGRIHTIKQHIEAGAEFVHGKLPVTLNLLKEAGLTCTPMSGKMYRAEKGHFEQDEESIEGWDELIENMGSLTADMTLIEFLETHYAEAKYRELREEITGFVQGFDLANPSKVSVKFLYNEWTAGIETNFRIDQGYCSMINFLADECRKKDCNIITGNPVTKVDWENGNLTVTTGNGQSYTAQKLIVTTSLGVLQYGSIFFNPAIDDYMNAASHIGWGSVLKIVLEFKETFWKNDTGFIFSNEKIPTWWTQSPGNVPVLTGWLGGPPAENFKQVPTDEILKTALESLSGIFQKELPPLVNSYILNWADDPETLGAYSYDTPLSDNARKVLNTPIQDTIYFAGEALYEGNHPGTVEAALVSGRNVAQMIHHAISL